MAGNGVIGRGDLAVTDAHGQDQIDVLEGLLGGFRALSAVAPADRQGVCVGNTALAADRSGHRRLEQLGDGSQRSSVIDAAETGVNSHALAAIHEMRENLAVSGLIER